MQYYTPKERIDAVKAFAKKHYDKDGWDIVVETMSDEDIQVAYGLARTPEGAIRNVAARVGAQAAYRDDIIAAGDDNHLKAVGGKKTTRKTAARKPAPKKSTAKKTTARRRTQHAG